MNLENSDIVALIFGMGMMLFFLGIVFFHSTYGQTVTPTPTYTPPQIQYAPIELKPAGQNDYLAMLMPLIVGAGTIIIGKFAKDTADKVKKQDTTIKENSAAIVDTKVVAQEVARLLFEWNKDKADALNGTAPAVKLEKLQADKDKAVDTAAKA